MRALLVWNMCVGSQDLCIWRLRNLAFGTDGSARVAFFTFAARVLMKALLSAGVLLSSEDVGLTVTFSSSLFCLLAFRFAPMALSFLAVSILSRMCLVAFLRRAVTVGVLSSAI